MKKMLSKTVTIPFSLLVLCALGLWFGENLYRTNSLPQSSQLEKGIPVWEIALDKVEKIWLGDLRLDDEHMKKNCPYLYVKEDNIPKELKACRPELFKCYFEKRENKIKSGLKVKKFKIKFPSSKNTYSLPFDLEIFQKEEKYQYRFNLSSSCNRVLLPSGFYWGTLERDFERRVFHTSGVDYFIDRRLVRNVDVRFWQKTHSKLSGQYSTEIMNMKGKDLFKPVTKLLPKQMNEYCRDHRAQVLDSFIKTALTFHYGRASIDEISQRPPGQLSASHPFGPRKSDSFRYSFIKEKAEFKEKYCRQIFSKECVGKKNLPLFGMGWSGASELLGGPMEYVINKKFPRRNVVPSSYYYPLQSKVHSAGKRIYWNEKTFDRKGFIFGLNETPEELNNFDVGFRCMEAVPR